MQREQWRRKCRRRRRRWRRKGKTAYLWRLTVLLATVAVVLTVGGLSLQWPAVLLCFSLLFFSFFFFPFLFLFSLFFALSSSSLFTSAPSRFILLLFLFVSPVFIGKQGRDMVGAATMLPPYNCLRRHVSFVFPTRGRPPVS